MALSIDAQDPGRPLESVPHHSDGDVLPDVCNGLHATAGEIEISDLPVVQYPE